MASAVMLDVRVDQVEMTALPRYGISSITSSPLSPPTLSADAGSSYLSPLTSSSPCPQPSPLSGVLASSSLLDTSPFSLETLSLPPPLPAPTRATSEQPSDALSSLTFRHFIRNTSPCFAPIPHRSRWARALFATLSHPLLLLSASLAMIAIHIALLYVVWFALYLLYTSSSHPLSPLPVAVFTAFLSFLAVRSVVCLTLVSLRVLHPQLWCNLPPLTASRLSRRFYPTLLAVRVLSLLFLLVATAALIFGTSLALSSPAVLVLFLLLSYDAVTLSLPLLIVPSLAFLLPLHSLHMSFPFIPLAPPRPAAVKLGMSASQLAQLDSCVWHSGGGESESEEVVCAVCICELSEGERVRRLPKCCHVFHTGCIDSWLERRASCPLCVRTVEVSPCVSAAAL